VDELSSPTLLNTCEGGSSIALEILRDKLITSECSTYTPAVMTEFFEKTQAAEKKRPGVLAKAFETHPPDAGAHGECNMRLLRFFLRSRSMW
jgi:hypothetical protein